MAPEEAQALARELVESRIQRVELDRLVTLNSLRELEVQLTVLKARKERDVQETAAALSA